MFCANCGNELKTDVRFCPNCGTRALSKSSNEAAASNGMITEEVHKHEQPINLEPNPTHHHEQSAIPLTNTSFSQPNPSDEDLAKRFIGKNSDYYLRKWSSSKKPEKRSGWNWAAFFFNVIWLANRKMYKYAFIYIGVWLAAGIVLELLNADKIVNILGFIMGISVGISGNALYYTFTKQNIENYRSNTLQQPLEEKGGTSRKGIFVGIGAMLVCGIILGVLSPSGDSNKMANNQPVVQTASTTPTLVLTDEQKAKAAKAAEEAIKNPKWNTSEVDVSQNGNLPLAINMIKAIKDIPAGEAASPAQVIKAPWNYYGKPIIFKGSVGVVEDYPPDSQFGKAGLASEIVIECPDGTIADFFSMVPSGLIRNGQFVTITGYPIGRTQVENKIGGKFTHLIVVTNRLN